MRRISAMVCASALVAAASLVAVGVAPANASTECTPVTESTDSIGFPGELRYALEEANVGTCDTIVFSPGLTIPLVQGLYYNQASAPLTILGNGSTIQGDDSFRLLASTSTGLLSIDGLTFTKGNVGDSDGGAISANGPVTVTDSAFVDNVAHTSGGAIWAQGLVTVEGSSFSGNEAYGQCSGGAIDAAGGAVVTNSTFTDNRAEYGDGGAIHSHAALTVTGSTFVGNEANNANGGAIASLGPMTVTDSTFTGNTAGFGGGALASPGPGIGVSVTGSTFTGNTADEGGAIASNGPVRVTSSTITGNTAGAQGGGINLCNGTVELTYATIVANSSPQGANINGALCAAGTVSAAAESSSFGSVVAAPAGGGTNCARGVIGTAGYNVSDDDSCGFTAATDVEDAGALLLGPLADNGGTTWTRLPQPGSPLIDAIPNARCGDGDTLAGFAITTDQRGFARPEQTGGKCDIGAVEVQLPPEPAPPVEVYPTFTG